MSEVKCSWVPGTLDTLHVVIGERTARLKVVQLRQLFGIQALNAIYLQGYYQTVADQDIIERILAA
ncbi:hypothetical protein E5F05_03415 (plasmid) [Deinococcus metallilatus]|uniref:Uncharacterized protein n=1 Tax=Deinococcus metallilatus TaxID=1211322 RepID=A0AAJ5F6Y9_9DEIO|nr:hypothetical protein [Deinococcus metallilatus]MBB5297274.1 hypothetical protein [Deinococcus metallilatus]QBY06979.1 hypothetical protein E5F05_03415 [Deinococcus metallilatus]TLK31926.1 hypothetical protein FCS05_00180 [Deinococcus metallilatus]GMA17162.1 hypothetical protein GCM10025871_34930 [Deinococcus metallilatus]